MDKGVVFTVGFVGGRRLNPLHKHERRLSLAKAWYHRVVQLPSNTTSLFYKYTVV
jgi:hypothetical protein